MKFEKSTIDYLKKMGWSEDRVCDPSPYLDTLVNEGFSIFPAAKKFLESFGGLAGVMPAYRKEDGLEEIHFDPGLAMENIYREKVKIYEERFGQALVVVGEAYSSHLTILLSSGGSLLGGYDEYLCLLGESIEQGINSLFEKKEGLEIG